MSAIRDTRNKKRPFRVSDFAFLVCLIMPVSAQAAATNIYIAQNAAGAASGADCNDAYAYTFFNSSANWTTGTPSSAQIGPGTTVHLCGTFTGTAGSTMLTVQGSGASGSPVTILFDNATNGNLTAPYWGANGAIYCTGSDPIDSE